MGVFVFSDVVVLILMVEKSVLLKLVLEVSVVVLLVLWKFCEFRWI